MIKPPTPEKSPLAPLLQRGELRVVKLGGSLADSAQLPRLLRELARLPDLVIAPGGGPFADAVRRAQKERGFDDAAAHDMALLAMAQFGRMLAAQAGFRAAWGAAGLHFELSKQVSPGFRVDGGQSPAPSPRLRGEGWGEGISPASGGGRVIRADNPHETLKYTKPDTPSPLIWLPDPATDALEVERSWRITGDSLALWLARRLGAHRLVLLKSCPIPATDLTALAAAGIVDEIFPGMAREYAEVGVSLVDATRTSNLQDELDGCDRPISTAQECVRSLIVVS